MLLIIALLACTAESPWWESEDPCPPGAELTGTPWPADQPIARPPGPIPPEHRAAYTSKYGVLCRTGEGRFDYEGPSLLWWGNGQPQMVFVAANGGITTLEEWDEYGHLKHQRQCPDPAKKQSCHGERTWWHHTGKPGIQGSYEGRQPLGIWKEWDKEGTLIGEVDFGDGGEPEVILGTSTRLLIADIVEGGDVSIAPTEGFELPKSTATVRPKPAINLSISEEHIAVDGVRVAGFDDLTLGHRLAERLAEKRAQHEAVVIQSDSPDFDGRILVQVHASLPYSRVAKILEAASDSGYSKFDVVVENPLRKLPPFQGPPRAERWSALATFAVTFAGDQAAVEVDPDATIQDVVSASDKVRGQGQGPVLWSPPPDSG